VHFLGTELATGRP